MAEVTIRSRTGETRQIDESAVPFFPGWRVVRDDKPSSAKPAQTTPATKE